jgi:hypothetical protein
LGVPDIAHFFDGDARGIESAFMLPNCAVELFDTWKKYILKVYSEKPDGKKS